MPIPKNFSSREYFLSKSGSLAFLLRLFYYGLLVALCVYGGIFIYLTVKARRERDQNAFKNNLTYTLVFYGAVAFAVGVSPFQPVLVFPLDAVILLFLAVFLPIFYYFVHREKQHPGTDAYERPEEGLTFKYEIIRKLTHFVIVGVFLVYFYFGPYFMVKFNQAMALAPRFWGISDFGIPEQQYGQYFAVFWILIAFFGLATADSVRILKPNAYPLKKVNRILRKDELHAKLGPHIAMTVGVLAIVLTIGPYAPSVACAAIAIGCFGDAAANIIGKKLGRHKIRKGKTLEGLIGGAVVSFISAFAFLIYEDLFTTISRVQLGHIALVALGGTLTFVFVDFFSPSISDNLLNPFLSGSVMAILTAVIVL